MIQTVSNAANVICHLLNKMVNSSSGIDEALLRSVNWEDVRELVLSKEYRLSFLMFFLLCP